MMKEENREAGVEIIDAAAKDKESEIASLTRENMALKQQLATITRDLDQYRKWWSERCAEIDKLRNLVKAFVKVADFN